MRTHTRSLRAVAAGALLAAIACSSSMEINYDYDATADFDRYRTYKWLKHASASRDGVNERVTTGGPIDTRVRNAADANLGRKGLTKSDDSPDLLVIYHFGTQEKIQATSYGYSYYPHYYGWGGGYPYYSGYGGHRVDIYQYTEGTLVLDLIDAGTDQLVWRGYATDTLEQNPSPEKVEGRLDDAFHRMLTNYPPRR